MVTSAHMLALVALLWALATAGLITCNQLAQQHNLTTQQRKNLNESLNQFLQAANKQQQQQQKQQPDYGAHRKQVVAGSDLISCEQLKLIVVASNQTNNSSAQAQAGSASRLVECQLVDLTSASKLALEQSLHRRRHQQQQQQQQQKLAANATSTSAAPKPKPANTRPPNRPAQKPHPQVRPTAAEFNVELSAASVTAASAAASHTEPQRPTKSSPAEHQFSSTPAEAAAEDLSSNSKAAELRKDNKEEEEEENLEDLEDLEDVEGAKKEEEDEEEEEEGEEEEEQRLHFGAKVSLTILSATILLVASATFVDLSQTASRPSGDCQQGPSFEREPHEEELAEHELAEVDLHELPIGQQCCGQGQATESSLEQQQQRQQQQLNSNLLIRASVQQQSAANQLARDQRSPSLSSSNSSSLFSSSANSVASSSAPILGSQRRRRCSPSPRDSSGKGQCATVRRVCRRLGGRLGRSGGAKGAQYGRNLALLFAPNESQSAATDDGGSKGAEQLAERPVDTFLEQKQDGSGQEEEANLREQKLAEAVLRAESWRRQQTSERDAGQVEFKSREEQIECVSQESPLLAGQLLKQLFLAFSLRHSASIIFQQGDEGDSDGRRRGSSRKERPREGNLAQFGCHRSRLSSLTRANLSEQKQQQQQDDNNNNNQSVRSSKPHESIDSLHGLRFLSMIWIIVIHSYHFAFQWLFFTNSSALDNIYKTAASQLLANGTFACDSFFFAGGFLLPYLAFPAFSSSSSTFSPGDKSPSPNQEASAAAAAATGASSSDSRQAPANGGSQHCSSPLTWSNQGLPGGQASRWKHNNSSSGSSQQQQHLLQGRRESGQANGMREAGEGGASALALHTNEFTVKRVLANILHRYVRMMPLMMAIIGLSATLLRYLGEGPIWEDSTMMFDRWCRKNWWINGLFLHNFLHRENMCLSHSWYSAVDIQLFLMGQLLLFLLFRHRLIGLLACGALLLGAQLITGTLTLVHHLPAVPLIASVSEQSINLYYGEIYIKPYCRASPYLIGILLAYLMRTTSLGTIRLKRWQVVLGWSVSIGTLSAILLAMQPAMNGQPPSELQSALYSALSRPLWACATGWMIFACMTNHGGIFASILSARPFIPLSRLTYPAFLIHPIVMAVFYGSRQASFTFSHYLMLYLILGNIVITYASAFILSALFELPLLSGERAIRRALANRRRTLKPRRGSNQQMLADGLLSIRIHTNKRQSN